LYGSQGDKPMPLSEIVLIIMGLLTLAMLAAGICQRWSVPYTVFLVIIGITLGFFAREIDTLSLLLEFQLNPEIVLFIFLPALRAQGEAGKGQS
jgi:hypothetical protein